MLLDSTTHVFFGAIIKSTRKRVQHLGVKFKYKEGGNVFNNVNELKRKKDIVEMSIMELLIFADDAVLMSDTVENLQNIVDAFVEVTEAFGQEVSIKKTEVMAINVQVHANPLSIFIKGKKLNVVHDVSSRPLYMPVAHLDTQISRIHILGI